MFQAVEKNIGYLIADGTNTRKVAQAFATLAGISDMGIWELPNHGNTIRERVAVISQVTLKRIQRHPDPEIDYEMSIGRVYDEDANGLITAWRPTNRYIIRVNAGIDLTSFENIGELLKQSARSSIPEKLRSLLDRFLH